MEPISEFDQLITSADPPTGDDDDFLVPENNADGQQKEPSPSFMTRRGLYWHFVCHMESPEALDVHRRAQGLYMQKLQGTFRLQCSMSNCPYKMKAFKEQGAKAGGAGKGWALFECDQHNHPQASMVPIGQRARAVRFHWHFVRRMDSLGALDAHRRERGLYMQKLPQHGNYKLQCAKPTCPYKMKALKGGEGWALFDCDQHNHQMVPIRMRARPLGSARWHFVCRMESPEALDSYRRERGLYMMKQNGIIRLLCSMPGCLYRMKAIGGQNGEKAWSLFECKKHNHQSSMKPIGKGGRKSGGKCNSNEMENSKLEEEPITNGRPKLVLKIHRDPSSPTDRGYRCSLSSEPSEQGEKSEATERKESEAEGPIPKPEVMDRNPTEQQQEKELIPSETKPEQPEERKKHFSGSEQKRNANFSLTECRGEMERIGAKWKLVLKEKSGSFLFIPPRLSKAHEDGVLLAFTDRGDHVRVDLFHGVQLQTDKLQRWPKFRGPADFLHRMQAQCTQIFGGE